MSYKIQYIVKNKKAQQLESQTFALMYCGERGIRTPGTFDSTSDFESGALNQLCHLSFTRRSFLPEGQGSRQVYYFPKKLT